MRRPGLCRAFVSTSILVEWVELVGQVCFGLQVFDSGLVMRFFLGVNWGVGLDRLFWRTLEIWGDRQESNSVVPASPSLRPSAER